MVVERISGGDLRESAHTTNRTTATNRRTRLVVIGADYSIPDGTRQGSGLDETTQTLPVRRPTRIVKNPS
jgi:hypothetical protein